MQGFHSLINGKPVRLLWVKLGPTVHHSLSASPSSRHIANQVSMPRTGLIPTAHPRPNSAIPPPLKFCKSVAREVGRKDNLVLIKLLFDVGEDCKLFGSDFPRKWKRCEY
jgi:hypothetical protein